MWTSRFSASTSSLRATAHISLVSQSSFYSYILHQCIKKVFFFIWWKLQLNECPSYTANVKGTLGVFSPITIPASRFCSCSCRVSGQFFFRHMLESETFPIPTPQVYPPLPVFVYFFALLKPIQFHPCYCPLLAVDCLAYGCQQLVRAAPGAGFQGVVEQGQSLQLQLLGLAHLLHDVFLTAPREELPVSSVAEEGRFSDSVSVHVEAFESSDARNIARKTTRAYLSFLCFLLLGRMWMTMG